MNAKLIFYKSPKTGDEIFNLCPITKGCENCPLPPRCKGESDKNIAFNLRVEKGHYQMSAIRRSGEVKHG